MFNHDLFFSWMVVVLMSQHFSISRFFVLCLAVANYQNSIFFQFQIYDHTKIKLNSVVSFVQSITVGLFLKIVVKLMKSTEAVFKTALIFCSNPNVNRKNSIDICQGIQGHCSMEYKTLSSQRCATDHMDCVKRFKPLRSLEIKLRILNNLLK